MMIRWLLFIMFLGIICPIHLLHAYEATNEGLKKETQFFPFPPPEYHMGLIEDIAPSLQPPQPVDLAYTPPSPEITLTSHQVETTEIVPPEAYQPQPNAHLTPQAAPTSPTPESYEFAIPLDQNLKERSEYLLAALKNVVTSYQEQKPQRIRLLTTIAPKEAQLTTNELKQKALSLGIQAKKLLEKLQIPATTIDIIPLGGEIGQTHDMLYIQFQAQ